MAYAYLDPGFIKSGWHGQPRGRAAVRSRRTGHELELAAGELLFHDGDRRGELYRLVSGSLCHYIRWPAGRHDVIEFASAGDIVGFGHLDRHVTCARAITATRVRPVSQAEFERTLETDARLAMRFASAGDREFEVLRARQCEKPLAGPLQRLAAFLATVTGVEAAAGCGSVVPADATGSWAAEALQMSEEALASSVSELVRCGALTRAGDVLRVSDAAVLVRLADAA